VIEEMQRRAGIEHQTGFAAIVADQLQ